MKSRQHRFPEEIKLNAVLRLLKGETSAVELSQEIGCHPTIIAEWKTRFLHSAHRIFTSDRETDEKEKRFEELERMIGKLTVQNEFLKKVYGNLTRP